MKYKKKKLKINTDEKKIDGVKNSPILIRQVHDTINSPDHIKNIKHTIIVENARYKYRYK